MDNKIIIKLIKQEVEELRLLVSALDQHDAPHGVLIDVTKSKIQTLVQVSALLKGNGESTNDTSSEIRDEALQQTIIDSMVDNALADKPVVLDDISKAEPAVEAHNLECVEGESVENIEEDVSSLVQESEIENQPEKTINTVSSNGDQSLNNEKEQEVVVGEQADFNEQKKFDLPEVENKPKHMVLGERFMKDKSLNERFTVSKESNFKIKGKPVVSVKKSIGLNDRFMFTRELFNNDTEKYNLTVEAIDNANNFVEAIEYLDKNCKWPKSETSLKFMDMVKRRFDN